MLSFSYLEVSSADEDLAAVLLLLRTVVLWFAFISLFYAVPVLRWVLNSLLEEVR